MRLDPRRLNARCFKFVSLQAFAKSSVAENISAACILERPQVLIPELPAWENEYISWRESENRGKQAPQQTESYQSSVVSHGGPADWEPASRRTAADETNNRKSLQRRLDSRIFLFIKPEGSNSWSFPQQQHTAGEEIADTARRAIEGVIGHRPQVFFLGRAPHAHLQQSSSFLFLHRAQLIQGRPSLLPESRVSDYLWLAKDEVPEIMPEGDLAHILTKLL